MSTSNELVLKVGSESLALNPHEVFKVVAQPGDYFQVVDGKHLAQDVVVVRDNANLVLHYPNGSKVIIENYFIVCESGECEITLPNGDGADGVKLSEVLASQGKASPESSAQSELSAQKEEQEPGAITDAAIVYVEGSSDTVMEILQRDPALSAALNAAEDDGDEGWFSYWSLIGLGVAYGLYEALQDDEDSAPPVPAFEGDDAPVTISIVENGQGNLVVHDANATATGETTPDAMITYSLAGPDAAAFSIDAATGELTLLEPADFEAKSSYSVDVIATSDVSGTTATQSVVVNVTDQPLAIEGLFLAGPVVAGHGLVATAYTADGTVLGSAMVNDDGTFSIDANPDDYDGPVLVRVHDGNDAADYFHEGSGQNEDLTSDLRAIGQVDAEGVIRVNVNALTETAVRQLLGDQGGDGGEAPTVLGTATSDQAAAHYANVLRAFGLDPATDLSNTDPHPVNAAGFSEADATAQALGHVLAVIAAVEVSSSLSTAQVLELLAEGSQSGVLSQELLTVLETAAALVDTVDANAGGTETFFTGSADSGVDSITISDDSGSSATDFLTNVSAQTVSATLIAALSGEQSVYGSVDGGATWVDIAAASGSSVSGTAVSWVTSLSATAASSRIVIAVTSDGAEPAADASNISGRALSQGYVLDQTPPALSNIELDAAENGTVVEAGEATDANGIAATGGYTLSGTDAALFTVSDDGELAFISPQNFEAPGDADGDGVYNVNVTVTDVAGNSTTRAVTVTLQNVNEAPVVGTAIVDSTAVVDQMFSLDVSSSFSDPDAGDTLSYSATGLPAGLTISAAGVISGTATAAAAAADIVVTATDGQGLTVSDTLSLTVFPLIEITSISASVVSGTAGPNSSIRFIDTAGNEYEAAADDTGSWSVTGLALTRGPIQAVYVVGTAVSGDPTSAVVDFVPPVVTITEASANVVKGTAEVNASIAVDVDGDGTADYTTTADASGNWSVTPSPALASNTMVSVTATDAASNTSDPVTATTAPTVTVNSHPNTADGSRDYVEAAFFGLGDTITVTVDYGETITDAGVSGSLTVGGLTFSNVAVSGTTLVFSYTVAAADSVAAAGFTTDLSANLTVTGATIGGNPVPTAFSGDIALNRQVDGTAAVLTYTDTGAADGITDDATISVSNLAASSATWEYSVDGGTTWTTGTAADASGNASFTVTAPVDGAILVRDGGVTSNPLDYVKVVASLITVTTISDNFGDSTGVIADGGTTDDLTPTISGTLAAALSAGDTVEVFSGATSLGNAVIGADGLSWSLAVGSDLSVGEHLISAQINYSAGATATSANVTITTVAAPAATLDITSADLNVGTTGSITSGEVSTDLQPVLNGTVTGTLGANDVVAIYSGGVRLGEATVDTGAGSWVFSYEPQPATFTVDSNPNITVSGNSISKTSGAVTWGDAGIYADQELTGDGSVSFSGAQNDRQILVGLNAPGDLADDAVTIDFAFYLTHTGAYQIFENSVQRVNDGSTYTSDTVFRVAREGSAIKYYVDDVLVYTSTETSTGPLYFDSSFRQLGGALNNVTISPDLELASGVNSLTAVVEDPTSGLSGTVSAPFEILVLGITLDSVLDDAGAVVGNVESGGTTDDTTPTLSGTLDSALSGTQAIRIYDNTSASFLSGSATVNADNSWTFALDTLPEAGYDLIAGIYPDGTSTTALVSSDAYAVTVDVPPAPDAVASITAANDDAGSTTGAVSASGSTDDTTPTLSGQIAVSGTFNTGEVVAIYDGSTRLGEAVLNTGAGTWTFTADILGTGNHSFTAVVENPATGQAASPSSPFVLVIQSIALTEVSDDEPSVVGAVASGEKTDDTTPTLSGTLAAALSGSETIKVYYDDGGVETEASGTLTVNADNTWSFIADALTPAVYALVAKIEDGSGNEIASSGAYTIEILGPVAPAQFVQITTAEDDVATPATLTPPGGSTDDVFPVLTGTLTSDAGGTTPTTLADGQVIAIYNGATRLGEADITDAGAGTWRFDIENLPLTFTQDSHANITVSGDSITKTSGVISWSAGIYADREFTGDGWVAFSAGQTNQQFFAGLNGPGDLQEAAHFSSIDFGFLTNPNATYAIWESGSNRNISGSYTTSTEFRVAREGSAIKYYVDDVLVYTSAQISTGSLYFDTAFRHVNASITNITSSRGAPPLSFGSNSLTAVVEDQVNGLSGTDSAVFEIMVNNLTFDTVIDDAGDIVGNVEQGGVTDDTTLMLTGTLATALPMGQTVEVFDGGVSIGTATVSGTNWSFATSALSVGDHDFSAAVVEAGNVILSSESHSVTVAGTPTATVTITNAVDDVNDAATIAAPIGFTDDAQPVLNGTLTGTLAAGEVVAIYNGDVRLGEAGVDAVAGTWQFAYDRYALTYSEDPNANITVSGNSISKTGGAITWGDAGIYADQELTGDTWVSFTAAQTNAQIMAGLNAPGDLADDGFGSLDFVFFLLAGGTYQIRESGQVRVADSSPYTSDTVFRVAREGSEIKYYVDEALVYTSRVSSSGPLHFDSSFRHVGGQLNNITAGRSLELEPGSNSLTAVVENVAAGIAGTPSDIFDLNLLQVSIGTVFDNVGNTVGPLASGDSTDDTLPELSGVLNSVLSDLPGNKVIQVFSNGAEVTATGTLTVNGTDWSWTPDAPLTSGDYSFVVKVIEDPAGAALVVASSEAFSLSVAGATVPDQTVTIDTVTDDVLAYTGSVANGQSTNDDQLNLAGTVSASLNSGEALAVYAGSTRLGDAVVDGSNNWTFTTPVLGIGLHSLTARVENTASGLAGTASGPRSVIVSGVSIDAVSDNVGDMTGNVADAGVTDDTSPTISGTLAAALGTGESVVIFANGAALGSATVTGSTWSYAAALAVGEALLQAKVLAADGVTVLLVSDPYTISVTDAAAVPSQDTSISGVADDATVNGSVTGNVAADSTTDDTTLQLSGDISAPLQSGEVVAIYSDATRLGEATVTAGATVWTFDATLSAGTHNLSALVENPSNGQTSTGASATHVVHVQTLSITGIRDDGATPVTNILATDATTDDTTPTISGSLIAGVGASEELAVYNGANLLGVVAAGDITGNTWTFTPGTALSSGQYDLTVVVQATGASDLSLARAVSTTQSIMIANAAPTQTTTISSVVDDVASNGSVTGNIADGASTDDAILTLNGTLSGALEAGQVVAIYDTDNGVSTRIGEITTTTTLWSFDTPALGSGAHSLTARVENTATGAQAAASAAHVVNVQTLTVDSVAGDDSPTNNVLVSGDALLDATPTITGTVSVSLDGSSSEEIALYNGSTRIAGTVSWNGTQWSFVPSSDIAVGEYSNLRVMIQPLGDNSGAAGNVVSSAISLTIVDAAAPATTPSIISVTDDVATGGSVSGAVASGSSTDDTQLVISGTTDNVLTAGQVVVIYDQTGGVSNRIGKATLTGATTWEFTTPTLAAGSHSFTAVVENSVNRLQGTMSGAHEVVVQQVTIDAVTSDDGNVLALEGNITEDATLTLSGTSAGLGSGETLGIFNGSTQLGTASVNADGSWSFDTSTLNGGAGLAAGAYDLKASVLSAGGAVQASSALASIIVAAAVAPTQIANISSVADDINTNGSVTGSAADGSSTDDDRLLINGTIDGLLDLGQVVVIYDGAIRLGEATVEGTLWTFATAALAGGSHTFSAIVESAGGLQSTNAASGNDHTVIVQAVAITGISDDVGSLTGNLLQTGETSTDDSTLTLSGTLFAGLGSGEELAVYNGTTLLGLAAVDGANNTWSFTPATDLDAGNYDFVVMVQPVGDTSGAAGRAVARAPDTIAIVDQLVALTTATILAVNDDESLNGSVTGAVANGTSSDDTQLSLSGQLAAPLADGQSVVIYNTVNGIAVEVGTAVVDGSFWSLTAAVGVGDHQFTAVVAEPATGRVSTPSAAYEVHVGQASNIVVTDDAGDIQGTVQPRSGRYVAVAEFNESGVFNQAGVGAYQEIEVWAYVNGVLTNVALNKEVTYDYRTTAATTGTEAVDGDLNTRANTGSIDAQGIEIDLGAEYQIVSITVNGGHATASTQRAVGFSSSPYFTTDTDQYPSTHPVFDDPDAILSFGDVSGVTSYSFETLDATDDSTPTLSGSMGANLGTGEVLAVYASIDGVTTRLGDTTLAADGSWSFTPATALSDGSYLIWAQIEDATTGAARVVSADRLLAINAAPVTAEVSSIQVQDDSASGATLRVTTESESSSGMVDGATTTDDRAPTLSGTLSQVLGFGQMVTIYDGATRLGEATVEGTSWSYQVPEARPLENGQHTLRAVVESASGSVGPVDQTIDINIQDQLAVAIDATAGQDAVSYVAFYVTGASSVYELQELEIFSNGVKQDYAIAYQRNEAHGRDTVDQAFNGRLGNIDDGTLETQWQSSSNWFGTNAIAEGAFFVLILEEPTQIDAIKLQGLYTSADATAEILTFTDNPYSLLDSSLALAQAAAVNSHSISNPAGSTNDYSLLTEYTTGQTPLLSGTLQAALGTGEELAVYDNGIEIGVATVNADLTWTFTSPTLTPGSHSLVVQIQDSTAGSFSNGRVISQAKNIVVAEDPVQSVSIDSVGDDQGDAGSATGPVANGGSIDDTTPTLNGTVSAALADGQVIAVYQGATRLGEAVVDGLNWSFTVAVAAALDPGVYSFTAQAENPATGNSGTADTIDVNVQRVDITGLADDEAGGATGDLLQLTGSSARYVRIELDHSQAVSLNIDEVEVWAWVGGELINVAAGQPVTSVVAPSDTTSLEAVTDGSITSGYGANRLSLLNHLQIDLGSDVVIDHVIVNPNLTTQAELASDLVVTTLDSSEQVVESQRVAIAPYVEDDSIVVSINDRFASNDTTPVISGTLAVGLTGSQVVALYDNGVLLGNAVVTGTTWSYSASLTEGEHDLEARIVDGGSVIASSANSTGAIELIIDTQTPGQSVTITSATDDVAANSVIGSVASGTSSDDESIVLSGTVSDGLIDAQVLAIYDGGTKIGEATVAADNTWTFVAADLAPASHSFTARVDNTATGASGTASDAFTVITQAVTVTGISDDSGAEAVNLRTANQNAEAARFVRVHGGWGTEVEVWALVDGVLTNVALGKDIIGADIRLQHQREVLVDGSTALNNYASEWVQIDLGEEFLIESIRHYPLAPQEGYGGTGRIDFSVQVSTSRFDMTGLSADQLASSDVTTRTLSTPPDAVAGDPAVAVWTRSSQSADTTPTLSGTLGAALGSGEVVAVYHGDTRLGSADVTGTDWSFTPGELAAGTYTLRVQVEDGVTGTASTGRASSEVYTLVVDGAAPTATVTSITLSDDLGAETGIVAPGGITDDTRPTVMGSVSGTLSANQRVAVYDGAERIGYADVEGASWSFTPVAALGAGSHSLSAVVENIASGAQSAATPALTFTVQSLAITGLADDSGFLQGNILNYGYEDGVLAVRGTSVTDDQDVTLSGQVGTALEAGQVLRLYDGGAPIASVSVAADLTWSVDLTGLSLVNHEFYLRLEDSSGNALISSEAIDVTVGTDADSISALLGNNSNLRVGGLDRHIDLTAIDGLDQPQINSIGLSDAADSGSNQVTLALEDVLGADVDLYNADNGYGTLDSNGAHQLLISGDVGDTVVLADGGDWSLSSTIVSEQGGLDAYRAIAYNVYTNSTDPSVQLLIDDDVTVVL